MINTLETKVKKSSLIIMITTASIVFLISYFSCNNIIHKEIQHLLRKGETKIIEAEYNFNDFFNISSEKIITLKNELLLKSLFSISYNNVNNTVTDSIIKSENICSIGFIDFINKKVIKYEKNNVGHVILIEENKIDENIYKHYNKNTTHDEDEVLFTTPYLKNNNEKTPIIGSYMFIMSDKKISGILFTEFYVLKLFKYTLNSDIFDMFLYNENGDIIYNNNDKTINDEFDNELSLLYKHSDYKRMLTTEIYNNGNSISKLFKFNHNVTGYLGLHLAINTNVSIDIENSITHIYYIYSTIFLVMLIIMGVMIKKHIYDSINYDKLQKYATWLELKNKYLKDKPMFDTLTGLGNKKIYNEKSIELFETYKVDGKPYSLFIFTIDNLKELKKQYGKKIEIEIIKLITNNLKMFIRTFDIFIRYNENTFLLLLPNTNEKFATKYAQKILIFIKNIDCSFGEEHIKLVISASVSTLRYTDSNPYELFNRVNNSQNVSPLFINKDCIL